MVNVSCGAARSDPITTNFNMTLFLHFFLVRMSHVGAYSHQLCGAVCVRHCLLRWSHTLHTCGANACRNRYEYCWIFFFFSRSHPSNHICVDFYWKSFQFFSSSPSLSASSCFRAKIKFETKNFHAIMAHKTKRHVYSHFTTKTNEARRRRRGKKRHVSLSERSHSQVQLIILCVRWQGSGRV